MHHPIRHLPALAAATLLLASHPAPAQQPIRLGQTITSELTASDPRVSSSDSSHYKSYLYHGRRGEAVRVTMRSSAFDAFLSAGTRADGAYRQSAMNDDGAGGTDALLRYVFAADGDLEIHANSVSPATGAFTLALEAGTAPGPVVDHPITMGQTVRGTLTEQSPEESDGTYYEQYTFTGRAGQTVQVTMRSQAVDSYLNVGRADGGAFTSLATDDDGAGGNDARVVITLPSAGQYVIHANTLAPATGAYELTLEQGDEAAASSSPASSPAATGAANLTEIAAGQTVNGALATTDAKAADNSYYDPFVYHGHAGERLVITLRSSAFDSYLSFGTLTAGRYTNISSDDDSAGGSDSRLEVTLPAEGDYVIRANSLSANATGAYTLQVEKQ